MSSIRRVADLATHPADSPARRARRPAIAALVAIGVHLAVLGGGFLATRGQPAEPQKTAEVTVLTGRVALDGMGDFEANGYRRATVRAQR